ncbi:transcriptional regulator, PadR family [Sulfobacillus acidophilus DSM 10332]|uniref:Transcriptional regulator, PadR family n=1 Tax=Sulfobacillus acidophilus (strain ATCC 700253 / DSM 10332 / NAL) TaxID=679936 RepID=G8TZA6_SULAD|nr:transcriptional regulator, PadR family [Sulfobacillus acidophilus DSM 10332]
MGIDNLVPSLPVLLILRALEEGPAHGYKIARWIDEQSDHRLLLKEGTLYPTLHQLEQHGLIQGQWDRTHTKRPTKVYALTPMGRQRLEADRERWMQQVVAAQHVLGYGGI